MIANSYLDTEITSGGGTVNVDPKEARNIYFITSSGSVTLSSSFTFRTTGAVSRGTTAVIIYEADITPNGNNITILDKVLPSELADKKLTIVATHDGTSWDVKVGVDYEAFDDGIMQVADVTVAAATLTTGNTIPFDLIPSVSGRTIFVHDAYIRIAGGATAYTTNTTLEIFAVSASDAIFELDCLGVPSGTSPTYQMDKHIVTAGGGVTQFIQDAAIQGRVATGDPGGGGDRNARIILKYTVL